MKKENFYNKLDQAFLKKYPMLWILGVHFYVPIIVVASILTFLIGFAYPFSPDVSGIQMISHFSTISLMVTLGAILLTILFIIRQIRFNSKRIHHSLPYKHGFTYFISFFILLLMISALPKIGSIGGYFKAKIITENGVVSPEQIDAYGLEFAYDLGDNRGRYRQSFLDGIENKSIPFNSTSWKFWKYYLFISLSIAVLLYIICATEIRDFGWAMLVSALLPIVYGILAALMGLFGGFSNNLISGVEILFTLFVLVSLVIGFTTVVANKRVQKAFAIAVHLNIPLIVATYYAMIFKGDDVELLPYFLMASMVLGVMAFNFYYRKQYLDPQ